MSKTSCPSGHGMWNGDGTPTVWAFRVGFIRDFVNEHPDCMLCEAGPFYQMYDLTDENDEEDLDCWYCDVCKGLTVFVGLARYDFKRCECIPQISFGEYEQWEEYIALRDSEWERFQDFYEGMNPLDAIRKYRFEYLYKLSPDKKTILAIDKENKIAFAYWRSMYREFSPTSEIIFHTEDSDVSYRPYESYIGIADICVHENQYAHLKDGRDIIIDEVIEPMKRYRGRDVRAIEQKVEINHKEIASVSDEIE